jgi:hypothetical protein
MAARASRVAAVPEAENADRPEVVDRACPGAEITISQGEPIPPAS